MSRYTKEQRAAIYAGLGDINPDFVEGGNTTSYDDYISAVTKTIWRSIF